MLLGEKVPLGTGGVWGGTRHRRAGSEAVGFKILLFSCFFRDLKFVVFSIPFFSEKVAKMAARGLPKGTQNR